MGDLRRLEVAGGGGRARAITRELLVWVPPGYDDPGNAERAYPVLYMLDAQNLFDTPPGIPGEWRVDETMTWLIDSGAVPPMIIVGVPHAGALRIEEFLPLAGIPGAEPAAGEFIEWLIADVMPRVERAYRVSTDAEDTGIAGSSLGGLVAMVAGGEHPDVFGRALIESPSLLTGEGEGPRAFAAGVRRWPGRVFIGMGGRESAPDPDAPRNRLYTAWARELNDQVERTGSDRLLMIAPEARHTESAWADRFPVAIKFLFSDRRPGRGASTPEEDL